MADCDFCRRAEGLNILFTRYTIGKVTAFTSSSPGLPSVDEDFKATEKSSDEPIQYAKKFELLETYKAVSPPSGYGYLQKLLRRGYLYLHNEALGADGWSAYLITENSFLLPYEFNGPAPQPAGEPCLDLQHRAKCLTVSIPRPRDGGTKIWYKYSNTEWTEDLKNKYKHGGFREKYMQSFDVSAWANEADHQTKRRMTASMTGTIIDFYGEETESTQQMRAEIQKRVDELQEEADTLFPEITKSAQGNDIQDSPEALAAQELWLQKTDEARQARSRLTLEGATLPQRNQVYYEAASDLHCTPQIVQNLAAIDSGVVIPLDDPAAILIDISEELERYIKASAATFSWQEKTANRISTLEKTIKFQAQKERLSVFETFASKYEEDPEMQRVYELQNLEPPSGAVSEEILENAGNAEWNVKYAGTINKDAYVDNASKYIQKANKIQERSLEIANWHYKFIAHTQKLFLNVLLSEFDRKSKEHGVSYTELVIACIANTSTFPQHFGLYIGLFNDENGLSEDNFVLNALILNQEKFEHEINELKPDAVKISWTKIVSSIQKSLLEFHPKTYDLLSTYIGNMLGVIIPSVSISDKPSRGFFIFGIMTAREVEIATVEAYQDIMKNTLSVKRIQLELRNDYGYPYIGEAPKKNVTFFRPINSNSDLGNYELYIDRENNVTFSRPINSNSDLGKHELYVDGENELYINRDKDTRNAIRLNATNLFSIAGGIVQLITLKSCYGNWKENNKGLINLAFIELSSTIMSLAGTITGFAESARANWIAVHTLSEGRFTNTLGQRVGPKGISILDRMNNWKFSSRLSGLASIVMGIADAGKSYQDFSKEDYAAGISTGAAALSGIASGALFILAAAETASVGGAVASVICFGLTMTGVGIIFTGATIFFAVMASLLRPNPTIQWLRCCSLAKETRSDFFKAEAEEVKEYSMLLEK